MTKFWKILIEKSRYGWQIMNDQMVEIDLREDDGSPAEKNIDYEVVEENLPPPPWWVEPNP